MAKLLYLDGIRIDVHLMVEHYADDKEKHKVVCWSLVSLESEKTILNRVNVKTILKEALNTYGYYRMNIPCIVKFNFFKGGFFI